MKRKASYLSSLILLRGGNFPVRYVLLLALFCFTDCSHKVLWDVLPQIQSATFIGNDEAWLVTTDKNLLLTKDGGISWKKISGETVGRFEGISFIDSKRGWSVNEQGLVWRTEDGGDKWMAMGNLKSVDPEFHNPIQIMFADDLHGWILETFSIWCTEDGGVRWVRCFPMKDTGKNRGQPVRGTFINAMTGWVSATDGEIYSTVDGGRSWQVQAVADTTSFKDVYFIDERIGWLCGWPQGGIYQTEDGGRSWNQLLTQNSANNVGINSIQFLNKSDGWAVGQMWPARIAEQPPQGIVLHSTDGGQNWQPVQVGGTESLFDRVHFADLQHGWIFGRDNVYRTSDGGKTWHTVLKLQPIK